MTKRQLISLNLLNAVTPDKIWNAERTLTELWDMRGQGLCVNRAIKRQQRFIEKLKQRHDIL